MQRIFLAFFMLLTSMSALAYERTTNVYEAVVPLADRTEQVRNQAIEQGLEQVLIRYSGYSSIASIVGVAEELKSAQRYVIEYGVETIEMESADGLSKEQGDALWVRFNASLIDQLAHSLELPIWPTLRPTLSYVVVMDLWGEAHIPSKTEYPALYLHLERLFNERGIAQNPLTTTQLAGIKAEDLWNIDQQTAELLKSRSTSDVTLVIRLHDQTANQVELDFLFMEPDAETLIHQRSESLIEGLDQGINQYVDQLSTGLAFLGGADIELDLYVKILGMRSYSEYKKVLKQIAGLEQVLSVRMESATDQGIGYLIRYQSDRALLVESMMEITGIEQLPAVVNSADVVLGSSEAPLYFQYPNATFVVPYQNNDNLKPLGAQKPKAPKARQG